MILALAAVVKSIRTATGDKRRDTSLMEVSYLVFRTILLGVMESWIWQKFATN
ncbi:hypothetical protein J2Z58_002674 [Halobacillus andaensis]|nr:hypothetical protein [Halobacillus andaensis]